MSGHSREGNLPPPALLLVGQEGEQPSWWGYNETSLYHPVGLDISFLQDSLEGHPRILGSMEGRNWSLVKFGCNISGQGAPRVSVHTPELGTRPSTVQVCEQRLVI